MTDKLKQNQVNVADLLPVKMLLDEHVSPKSVTNVFAAQEIPVEVIGVTGAHIPFHKFSGLYEQAARLLGDVNFGVSCGAVWCGAMNSSAHMVNMPLQHLTCGNACFVLFQPCICMRAGHLLP